MSNCMDIYSLNLCKNPYYNENPENSCYVGVAPYNCNYFNKGCNCCCCPGFPEYSTVPTGMTPVGMIPIYMVPMVPVGMFPAGIAPADMVPADIAPVGMIPADMIPADMDPIGPPDTIVNFAIFQAEQQLLSNGSRYSMMPISLGGDAIMPGTRIPDSIILAPNKTYKYTVETLNVLTSNVSGSVMSFVELNGVKIPSTNSNVTNAQLGIPTVFRASGEFRTGNSEGLLFLVYGGRGTETFSRGRLTITEVQS